MKKTIITILFSVIASILLNYIVSYLLLVVFSGEFAALLANSLGLGTLIFGTNEEANFIVFRNISVLALIIFKIIKLIFYFKRNKNQNVKD